MIGRGGSLARQEAQAKDFRIWRNGTTTATYTNPITPRKVWEGRGLQMRFVGARKPKRQRFVPEVSLRLHSST
jgi:hypothetical protein